MNLRLSSNLMHQTGLNNLLKRQTDLARTQQELTTGTKLTQAKDDPAGMAAAQRLDHAISAIEQFGRNSNRLQSRLEVQETALGDAGNVLIRASELAIQANSSAMSDSDRLAIAIELRGLREMMISISNRGDGNGRALFAGTQDGVTPFTDNAGAISYHGNDGQIRMDVGMDLTIQDTNPGSEVFMRVPSGDGVVAKSSGLANTGSGVLASVNVTDSAAWAGATLSIRFTSASEYEVLDGNGGQLNPPVNGVDWFAGQRIQAQGVDFAVLGAPDAGDTFTMEKAPNQDVFSTLQALADAVATPTNTATGQAALTNALSSAIASLDTAKDHMLTIRAGTGARLSAIETAADARSADSVSLAGNLSSLRDTNVTEAISRLTLQLNAMEATQATMVRLQGMSLFDKL